MRALVLFAIASLLLAGATFAQDDAQVQSGIKVGEVLPGPFDAVVINGKVAKDRQHCLVTEFGLAPVVMVFAREPADGKDQNLTALLAKLDEAVSRHKGHEGLASCVVFLSPSAQNSTSNVGEADPNKL